MAPNRGAVEIVLNAGRRVVVGDGPLGREVHQGLEHR
jgi:hypothetical protein